MIILSWNVNGIRAAQKKGFLDWLAKESPDVVCVQETKAHEDQLDMALLKPPGYFTHWTKPLRKGYSGVATFSKIKPVNVQIGYEISRFDEEGRVLVTELPQCVIVNVYFPNGKASPERLRYKMDFYEETLLFMKKLKSKNKKIVVLGDYNTAHKAIDLARPKENEGVSGFLPIEREWLDRWVQDGQIDAFRKFNDKPSHYTWWDMKTAARERNVGWRIDYQFVTPALEPHIKRAFHMPELLGSDHCPVGTEMSF
jgi:exodeoxyribonuclease-3